MSTPQQKLNKLKNISPRLISLGLKKICILGFGIENQALVEFLLKKKVKCSLRQRSEASEITICDAKKDTRCPIGHRVSWVKWRLGKNYNKNLDQFDIIFRVAGYPLFKLRRNAPWRVPTIISSPTKLFFELCPTKNIIGVTGTKGKGTTASLIYAILKSSYAKASEDKRVWIGGNIGIPMFSFMHKIKKNDWVVLELSSFQLEDMTVSPKIAVITNFYKEHLAPADPNNPNYHRSLADYWKAKSNIYMHQKKNDKLVISYKLLVKNIKTKAKIIKFRKSDLPSKLIGEHNKENIAAAVEVVSLAGVKNETIKKAVAGFKGLEHRLEYIRTVNGIKYYNDSFATTPESAIIALKSFSQPIILLTGGADKGSCFKQFAKEINKSVKFVVLLNGKATAKIKKELLKIKYPKSKMQLVYNMKDAIKAARENADKGDIVLLSTACASFGMFKNYKERGKLFKQEVKKIA
ncbi:hypothetical protein KAU19_08040 [Candidatus Parcubacteria bacterium]|nr:hypothetical protein [Candidatus Parcubacteria bacterium]